MTDFSQIISFIRELYNMPEGSIPLHAPIFNGNEKKYLEECIDSSFVSSVGTFVDLFEEKIAAYTGAKQSVACVNGTNALYLALMMVGVEKDTEVITQPLTFIATANAISYCGAHPVFLDVDMMTLGLSSIALKDWVSDNVELRTPKGQPYNKLSNRRISGCLPMHTFGHPAKIDDIVSICQEYNIPVVEDAAESLGSFYKKQHTGTFGKIGVLSFNGNKILTTGGGGMMLFQDEDLARKAKHLTTQARVKHPWEFLHDKIGYNYRMPNINAALGLAQLEQLPFFLENKRELKVKYFNYFLKSNYTFFCEPPNAISNYWLNAIVFKDRIERDAFLKYSNNHGIMTRPAWELMHRLPMFKNSQTDSLSACKSLSDRIVNIPSGVRKSS